MEFHMLDQQPFSPPLGAGMVPTLPLSPPMQQHQQPLPLAVGLGAPRAIGGQFPQALELLIALVNENLRLMAAVEQQRLEQQQQWQTMGAGMEVETGARVDLRRERSAPPAPAAMNPGEGLGLETSAEHLEPSASPSSPGNRRPTRTNLLSTPTAPSNFTATASNSVSSNGSQSKRASVAHSQQTPTPPVSPRPTSTSGFPTTPSSPAISTRPSFKARISTPKPGRPFKISLSTVLGRDGGEGSSTRGLATPVEEVPPPGSPSPTSLVVSNARVKPTVHTGTLIDTRPSTALSDYGAGDDEERKCERPHSWLAQLRRGEELVLGGLAEEG